MSSAGRTTTTSSSPRWGGRLFKNIRMKPAEESTFEVNLVDGEIIRVDLRRLRQIAKYGDILIQDVVKDICKAKEIAPNSAGYFGIKCECSNGASMWMIQTKPVSEVNLEKKRKYYLRLQFKVINGAELKKRDSNAYLYYIKQCRYDFKNGAFTKELEGKENEKILLRMVILEMKMQYEELEKEEKLTQLKDILKPKYRKYFSMDEILKKNQGRDSVRDMGKCKQKVEKSLECFAKVQEPDRDFITEVEYLRNYREEIFHVQKYERGGNEANQVELWVSPKNVQKKVLITNIRTSLWESEYAHLQQIKFCETDKAKGIKFYMTRGENEPPEIMYCANEEIFESLCSFMDGYYRLLFNQYNSILYDSCEDLTKNPYFGPIERDIAVNVLLSKGYGRGTYLIREHPKYYGNFVLSMISNEDEIQHIQILQQDEDKRKFYSLGGTKNFESINNLIEYYSEPKNSGDIRGCLSKMIQPKKAGDVPLFPDPATFRPFIDRQNLKIQIHPINQIRNKVVFLGPTDVIGEKEIKEGVFGTVSKASSRDGEELLIRHFNSLKYDDLLGLLETLKSIQHEKIVSLIGISLSIHNVFLAEEYLRLGSLEMYLKEHRNDVTYGELLSYLNQVTDAMLFLHAEGLIHADLSLGNIYMQDCSTIKVGNACTRWKLSSHPNLSATIFSNKINYHAPEIILSKTKCFTKETDMWAFGLTIWQLFTLDKPFRNLSLVQLKDLFNQLMETKDLNQRTLAQLNMCNLYNCNDMMLDLLNGCMHFLPEKRLTMRSVKYRVMEILTKAPTKEKQQHFFTFEWSHESNGYGRIPSGEGYTTAAILLDGQLAAKANELNDTSGNLSTLKNEEVDVELLPDIPSVKDQGIYLGAKIINGSSHSAPSSPTRPKLHRRNSLSDLNKHDEEEFETASILVGMSQKCPQEDKLKRSDALSESLKPDTNSSMQLTVSLGNTNQTHPVKPASSVVIVTMDSECDMMGSKLTKPSDSLTIEEPSKMTIISQSPPPDSPEAVRREFPSEQSKKDFPKNYRMRLYIQDRINKERDRFHGKRSLSFTEEFDEYKNSTIRAAKRALLGPNPFNIGLHLPDDFLLRTDKRMCQTGPALPQDICRYFNNVEVSKKDFSHQYEDDKIHEGVKKCTDPYITMKEVEALRNSAEMKCEPSDMQGDHQVQSLMNSLEQMHAHSPTPIICDVEQSKCDTMNQSLGLYGSMTGLQSLSNSHAATICFPINHSMLQAVSRTDVLPLVNSQATLSSIISSNIPLVSAQPTQAQIRTQNISVVNAQTTQPQFRTQSMPLLNAQATQAQIRTQAIPLVSARLTQQQIRTQAIPLVSGQGTQTQLRTPTISLVSAQTIQAQSRTQTIPLLNPQLSQPQIRTQTVPLVNPQPTAAQIRTQTIPVVNTQPTVPLIKSQNISIVTTQPTQLPIRNHKIPLVSQPAQPSTTNPKIVNYIPAYPDIQYPINRPTQVQAHISGQGMVQYFSINSHNVSPRTIAIPRQQLISPAIQSQLSLPQSNSDLKNLKEPQLHIRQFIYSPNINISNSQPAIISPQISQTIPAASESAYMSREKYLEQSVENDLNDLNSEFNIIKSSDLKLTERLGKGTFGEVWKGEWNYKRNGKNCCVPVAVKQLISITGEAVPKEAIEDLEREAKHMVNFSNDKNSASQHIIKLYGICKENDSKFQIVQQLAVHGRIDYFISCKKKTLTLGDILNYCKQVAVGIDYLHSKNVIHRDIACRNILVYHENVIKISDFGLSRQSTENYYQKSESKLPLLWLALESMEYRKYTKETDYWSYGVAVWEMFTVFQENFTEKSVYPYEGIEHGQLHTHLRSGNRLPKPQTCTKVIWENIYECWNEDPTKRPCFQNFICMFNKLMKELNYTI